MALRLKRRIAEMNESNMATEPYYRHGDGRATS